MNKLPMNKTRQDKSGSGVSQFIAGEQESSRLC